ncbi:MAG: methyltransferase domain-containing protein [Acidilobaceae archaeon]|nr:methyltransferase domain-containing protein [Acidilobaceae archaeon]MCX8165832.1 methyltransferase domain-containing protein [Acidilobaceae archaeon]MDW7974256.1 methyltransferase domain-containing protein [Sulfolobales archaeon]
MIAEGELVTVVVKYRGGLRKYYLRARKGATYTTPAGIIRGADMIGAEYGDAVRLAEGVAYLLKPTRREVMEESLERVTQVIYAREARFAVEEADLAPGQRVLEGGTGSGFLTIYLASAVCPGGKVYSYDVKEENLAAARRNLETFGEIAKCVELKLGDVRRDVAERELDAGFLDVPEPWEALDHLWERMKGGAPLVVFLPSMNQLVKLISHVSELEGWIATRVTELMEREIEVSREVVRPSRFNPFMGYLVFLRKVRSPG